jgi:hypothetical protein
LEQLYTKPVKTRDLYKRVQVKKKESFLSTYLFSPGGAYPAGFDSLYFVLILNLSMLAAVLLVDFHLGLYRRY